MKRDGTMHLGTRHTLIFAALLGVAATCSAAALAGGNAAGRSEQTTRSSDVLYFPYLDVSQQPLIAAGIKNGSLKAFSAMPSPAITFFAENDMPIAASFAVTSAGNATWAVTHPDGYSRLGVIDAGQILLFTGHLPSVAPTGVEVTFSIVDRKSLAVNLFGRTVAKPANDLVTALNTGPGATLYWELKRELKQVLDRKESKIVLVKNIDEILVKFGVNRDNRKWLLDRLGANVTTTLKLLAWAKDVATAAGAYFGLAHAGVGGAETVKLYARSADVLPSDPNCKGAVVVDVTYTFVHAREAGDSPLEWLKVRPSGGPSNLPWAFADGLMHEQFRQQASGAICEVWTAVGTFNTIHGPAPNGPGQLPDGLSGHFASSGVNSFTTPLTLGTNTLPKTGYVGTFDPICRIVPDTLNGGDQVTCQRSLPDAGFWFMPPSPGGYEWFSWGSVTYILDVNGATMTFTQGHNAPITRSGNIAP